jgi:hypothetical protein
MDTSPKQQRTYEESERESWKRSGKSRGGNWKLKSLKKGRRKRTRKKVKEEEMSWAGRTISYSEM